jgi:hypothetical protein
LSYKVNGSHGCAEEEPWIPGRNDG